VQSTRNVANFLSFLKKLSARTHVLSARRARHLSTHTEPPEVMAWLERNPQVHFHCHPGRLVRDHQIRYVVDIITRQSSARQLSLGARPDQANPQVHRHWKHQLHAVCIDRDC